MTDTEIIDWIIKNRADVKPSLDGEGFLVFTTASQWVYDTELRKAVEKASTTKYKYPHLV